MGDLLSLLEREAIRTPMQWSEEPNAGFSTAPARKLVRPVISEGEYGYDRVNVEQQRRDPHSLLNTVERMIRLRKEHPEFGFGECTITDSADPAVFGIRASWQGNTTVAVHNLADRPTKIRLELPDDEASYMLDALGGARFERRPDGTVEVELEAYAFRWLRVRRGPGERVRPKPRRAHAGG
jgi:maltose alpha-D-glucosyltransferase/alpha-amylase